MDSGEESNNSLLHDNDRPKNHKEVPEVLLAIWYHSGTLWVQLNRAKNLIKCSGKIYGKTYLLPDSGNSKQRTPIVESTTNPEFNATIAVSKS